ncbi:MAG: ATP-binding protein [Planctomycetaceae bacterium]|nr:ATP-binding protein [Planctomycetaceae bacterium]
MNFHKTSVRLHKANKPLGRCSKSGQLQVIGEVDLPKVPESSPTESPEEANVPAQGACATGERITRSLLLRLGEERFAVWFGDNFEIQVVQSVSRESLVEVVVLYDPNYPGEWLQKTFGDDVAVAVRDNVNGPVTVNWRPLGEVPMKSTAGKSSTQIRAVGNPAAELKSSSNVVLNASKTQVSQRNSGNTARKSNLRRPTVCLEEFAIGPSNRMAFAAVELAANRLGEMSPVLLHGPSGVGKSHLLAGICHHARQVRPGLVVAMFSAEQFTTNFLQALHGSGLPGFRRSCRSVDLLAVDDLQFFVGKRATLLELQSTVDTLHRAGKQIIFASDRDVESLSGLGSELTGRLRGGMTAGIMPPDYEVRRGIVAGLAEKRQINIPLNVIDFLANNLTRHARELIGGINRLEAASHMLGAPVTLDLAKEALADLVRSSARSLRLADIEQAVCAAFGISESDLKSTRRSRAVNQPRMLAMFLARKHTGAALADIGRHFGRRSHSTVVAAEKTVRKWMTSQSSIVLADATWDVEQAIRRVEDVLRAG